MKVFIAITIPVFLLFAYLQLNDPDPYLWFPIYLAVSILALVRWFRLIPKAVTAFLVLFYLGFSAYFFTLIPYWNIDVEEVRETLGLLIAAGFVLGLGLGKKSGN